MKKWIVVLILLVCASVGFAEDTNRACVARLLGGANLDNQNNEIAGWLGYKRDNREVGVIGDWRMFTEADTDAKDDERSSAFGIGAYGGLYLPEVIDVNNFIPIEGLPEKFASDPMIGVSLVFDVKGKALAVSPFALLEVFETFGVMYEYRGFHGIDIPDKSKFTIGIQFPF